MRQKWQAQLKIKSTTYDCIPKILYKRVKTFPHSWIKGSIHTVFQIIMHVRFQLNNHMGFGFCLCYVSCLFISLLSISDRFDNQFSRWASLKGNCLTRLFYIIKPVKSRFTCSMGKIWNLCSSEVLNSAMRWAKNENTGQVTKTSPKSYYWKNCMWFGDETGSLRGEDIKESFVSY